MSVESTATPAEVILELRRELTGVRAELRALTEARRPHADGPVRAVHDVAVRRAAYAIAARLLERSEEVVHGVFPEHVKKGLDSLQVTVELRAILDAFKAAAEDPTS